MSIEDKDLGLFKLQSNARARRVVVRYRDGSFLLTHPSFMSKNEIVKVIESMKPDLYKLRNKSNPRFVFDEDTTFQTLTFSVYLKSNSLSKVYTSLKDGELYITYPPHVVVDDDEFQLFVRNTIENACRIEANRILPDKVYKLASIYNFSVTDVKINKSRTRWGSCSMKKSINLSYFCMMLPEHLVEFIILHELCHTKEMNHGPRFWALLDAVSNNKAQELTKELKQVKLKW